ncbi:MAG: hypothetical protein IKN65_03495 [Clostridia bacterium]|nr:hypothetical protein [Clostridia bacterium]
MKVEFDISKCSNRFIYELATLVDSRDVLKEIANYAINIAHYNDYEQGLDEDDCYLDAVVKNPKTPLQTILSIIEYPNAAYARWTILEELNLDYSVIRHFAKFENDFSLLCFMIRKYSLTNDLADIIAERMIKNEIKMTNVIDDDYDYKEEVVFNQNMEFIIHKCSSEWKEKLRKWSDENSWLDRKFDNMPMVNRTDLHQHDRTCLFHQD